MGISNTGLLGKKNTGVNNSWLSFWNNDNQSGGSNSSLPAHIGTSGSSQQLGANIPNNGNAGNQSGTAYDSGYGYDPYGYGGYSGYGYGGNGSSGDAGSSGPTESQVKAAKALAPIVAYGNETLTNKADQANRIYNDQDKANKRSMQAQVANARIQALNEWFSRRLKLQGVMGSNRDKMGNAAYGSAYLDWLTDSQMQHDRDSTEVLETYEANLANIWNDYYDSLQQSRNGRNEFMMDTEAKQREGFADYAAQLVNIHPDIATGEYTGTAENNDEGEKWPNVVDINGRKLNAPDWLKTSLFDENYKGPVSYKNAYMHLIRPDAARQKAYSANRKASRQRTSGSANRNYWSSLTRDYGNRRA